MFYYETITEGDSFIMWCNNHLKININKICRVLISFGFGIRAVGSGALAFKCTKCPLLSDKKLVYGIHSQHLSLQIEILILFV